MTKSDRIKLLRVLNGYTQESLAKRLDVPRTSLSIWEDEKKYGPTIDVVPKLASLLRTSPGYLVYGYPRVVNRVWIPKAPVRPQHLLRMIGDIELLLPQFLEENAYDCVIALEYEDGYAYLIGSSAQDGVSYPSDPSLLVVENDKLATSFGGVFSFLEHFEVWSMRPRYLDSFSFNDIKPSDRLIPQDVQTGFSSLESEYELVNSTDHRDGREKRIERALIELLAECVDDAGALLRPSQRVVDLAQKALSWN